MGDPRIRDIMTSERFQTAKRIPHHRKTSVARHSANMTRQALRLCRWLDRHGIHAREEDVIRACLLHDLGMTEERVFRRPAWIKAYTHPREGARIAEQEFGANEIQRDAIAHHMWPICIVPPRHLEGWIVLAADKIASVREAAGR